MGSGIVTIRAKAFALVLRALCVVALAMPGAAQGPKPSAAASPGPAAYTLPDGTAPVLCLPGSGDDEGAPTAGHAERCAACPAGAGFLPAPSDIAGWPMPEGTRAFPPWRGETPPPPGLLSGARPRAPP